MKQEYQRKPVPDWADMIAERDAKIESLRSEFERSKIELVETKAMKSVTVASDLRQTVRDELKRLNNNPLPNGSRGAVERNYLLAIGLIERSPDGLWDLTPQGREVLDQVMKEDL